MKSNNSFICLAVGSALLAGILPTLPQRSTPADGPYVALSFALLSIVSAIYGAAWRICDAIRDSKPGKSPIVEGSTDAR